jgi:hypothetical protein
MATFAKIDENNIVIDIVKVDDSEQHRGNEFLNEIGLTGTWIQTSYNTNAGVHIYGEQPLRANYAKIGGIYDPEYDVFYSQPERPYMILNTTTFRWEYPVPYPVDLYPTNPDSNIIGMWDDSIMNWKRVPLADLAPVINKVEGDTPTGL